MGDLVADGLLHDVAEEGGAGRGEEVSEDVQGRWAPRLQLARLILTLSPTPTLPSPSREGRRVLTSRSRYFEQVA